MYSGEQTTFDDRFGSGSPIDQNEFKDKYSPEELALVEVVHAEYIARSTQQVSPEEIRAAVLQMWREQRSKKEPMVIICDSPIACQKAAKAAGQKGLTEYWSIWYTGYAAMYDFANRIGLNIDKRKLKIFLDWVRCCPFALFSEEVIYVSMNPKAIHFDEAGKMHCDNGKSCEFIDGWGAYTIHGVGVDEQIVMHPETQTQEQIDSEQNEEVKAIRIKRFNSATSKLQGTK